MTDSDLIEKCGTDASKWASEFMERFEDRRDEIDEGLMIGWFANAIERTRDEATPDRVWGDRHIMPMRRKSYTQKFKIYGQINGQPTMVKAHLSAGLYEDGSLGEIFINLDQNSDVILRAMVNAFCVAVSLGLQHGVPLDKFVKQYTFTHSDPAGPVQGHDHIKMCTSLIDAIFRDLAITFLGRLDLSNTADVGGPL